MGYAMTLNVSMGEAAGSFRARKPAMPHIKDLPDEKVLHKFQLLRKLSLRAHKKSVKLVAYLSIAFGLTPQGMWDRFQSKAKLSLALPWKLS